MSASDDRVPEEHEISNPVEECKKWQKRYYRCVKKFGSGYMKGEARPEERDDCLERFDDFQMTQHEKCRSSEAHGKAGAGGDTGKDISGSSFMKENSATSKGGPSLRLASWQG
ncbi:unnamed protein product [Scytosiphon promiscuus]